MAKYVDVQVPILPGATATGPVKVVYTNSSTTTAAADGKLTDTGGTPNFTANVVVGDYVFITTAVGAFPIRSFSIVTAVDSASVLSISGRGNTGVTGLSASGTAYSIVAAANVYDCDKVAGGFISPGNAPSGVQVGDVWCNQTTNLNYRVTEVVSNTKIKLDTPGACLDGDDFFLLTDRADGGNVKVRVDNATLIRGNAADGETTIHYKKLSSTDQKLALTLGDAPSSAKDVFSTQFKKSAEMVMQDSWRYASITMPYVPSDGTQGIQWISTFTWS